MVRAWCGFLRCTAAGIPLRKINLFGRICKNIRDFFYVGSRNISDNCVVEIL